MSRELCVVLLLLRLCPLFPCLGSPSRCPTQPRGSGSGSVVESYPALGVRLDTLLPLLPQPLQPLQRLQLPRSHAPTFPQLPQRLPPNNHRIFQPTARSRTLFVRHYEATNCPPLDSPAEWLPLLPTIQHILPIIIMPFTRKCHKVQ